MSESKPSKVVALVGHCGPDSSFLRMAVTSAVPGTRVVMVDSEQDLSQALQEGVDLLLLNRRLDYGFEDDDGVEIVRRIKTQKPDQRVMMVSNYPETQIAAESAGALPGFGKREIGSARVKDRIAAALNGTA